MKLLIGIVVGIVVVVIAWSVLKGTANQSPDVGAKQNIKIETIQNDITAGGQLVDVRTPEEYAQGHITEATNLPVQSIKSGSLLTVDKDAPIYVYCRSGARSVQAASLLKDAGYVNVIDLGAMSAVQQLGGKVES